MTTQIDPVRAMGHFRLLSMALPEVMRLTKNNAGLPGAVAILIGESQGLARWLSPDNFTDEPLIAMARRTRGSMGAICVIICEPDNTTTCYLLNTLVSWQEHKTGFAITEQLYLSGDNRPERIVSMADPMPTQEDVFDIM